MAKIKAIGIIAEDDSDFDTLKVFIKRIASKDNLTFKKFTTNGCGKLRRKCRDYAVNLSAKGCNLLLIVHDLDQNNFKELNDILEAAIKPCPIKEYLVCIPIEELEAWLLSDPLALKNLYSLNKAPVIKGGPENVKSPKEELGRIIEIMSNRQKQYLNTKHNAIIANKINLEEANKKSPSFNKFYRFIASHTY